MTKYWTFAIDNEVYDADYDTKQEAQDSADSYFDEQCSELKEDATKDIFLIEYSYDGDGERVVFNTEKSQVEYEYYKGDFAEHNTLWNPV